MSPGVLDLEEEGEEISEPVGCHQEYGHLPATGRAERRHRALKVVRLVILFRFPKKHTCNPTQRDSKGRRGSQREVGCQAALMLEEAGAVGDTRLMGF